MSAEHNPATAPGQAASSAAEPIAPAVPTGVAHKVVSVGDMRTISDPPPTSSASVSHVAPPGYTIEAELGRGGMGVVYLATQAGLNRPVALKMILSGEHAHAREKARFLAEAEAVAAVKHPNVVQVYELGEFAGRPFLALEFCPGGTLAERVADKRLPPTEAAELVAKLADGVQAVHGVGTVHRDLKPANVLLDAAGEPKVTDFGLAKRGGADNLTRTGAVLGTPAYMAPEQASGKAKYVGPAADVYALGVILFECLCGRRPFESDDPVSLLVRVATESAPVPSKSVTGLPRDLDLIVGKCLAKEPAERYASASALAADLRAVVAGRPVSVRPPTLANVLRGWASQNVGRVGWVLPVGLAVGLVAGLFFWAIQTNGLMLWHGRAYDRLPSVGRPWPLRLAVELPEWGKMLVGLLMIVSSAGMGLMTVLLVRTRSRDADLAAGLAVGLVGAVCSFVLGLGPLFVAVAALRDAEPAQEMLGYAAWSDLPSADRPALRVLLDVQPDLRALGYDDRVMVARHKLQADVMGGAVAGLWVGLLVCLGMYVPFGGLSAVAAGRLVRSGRGWPWVLIGYFEWCGPLVMLIGLPLAEAGSQLLTSGRGTDWRLVVLMMASRLVPSVLAMVAVARGWWWPIRLVLHAAWLFAVFYW